MATMKRNYKDTLFRMIFREKQELLSLYNAVNGTNYQDPEDLEINTLENAVYMAKKNDVSFIFEFEMNLYEHQSTYNPNMPLRDLFYVTPLLEKEVADKTLYTTALVTVPTPRFFVFYNGTKDQPERTVLKLSDAFQKKTSAPELELTVTMLNINAGFNKELQEQCQTLREYIIYVQKIRDYAKEMELEQAVELAVDECIEENILRKFLTKYKAEVIQVSIFEYDEEKEMKKIRQAEYEVGIEQGQFIHIISMVRKKTEKHLDIQTIADILEIEEVSVAQIVDFIKQNPDDTDMQVAAKLQRTPS